VIYVALLRGINVGGKNRVEMGRLRATFEDLGLARVSTYINTGNVIFSDENRSTEVLVPSLEAAIAGEFGFDLKVLLRDIDTMSATEDALPAAWANDAGTKSDVMFLWEGVDDPSVIDALPVKAGIDEVVYVPGAVMWRVDRANLTRSGMRRLVGTKLYREMTIRNCNTVRKLVELMRQASA
jgi:uncharacterized protein (DUF1697 family)